MLDVFLQKKIVFEALHFESHGTGLNLNFSSCRDKKLHALYEECINLNSWTKESDLPG